MKKLFKLNILLLVVLLAGCRGRNNNSGTTSTSSGGSSTTSAVTTSGGTTSSETSITSESIPSEEYKRKYTVNGENFGNNFNPGTQFSSTEHADQNKKLVTYLNEEHDYIKSIDCEGCASQAEDKNNVSTCHLTLGSQKALGEFTINFKYYIKSVKIEALGYYSYYQKTWEEPVVTVYNTDLDPVLVIEDNEFPLEAEEGKPSPAKEVEFTLPAPKKSIKVANKEAGHRVFINSILITYYA